MTPDEEMQRAVQEAEESTRRAQEELTQARERAGRTRTRALRWRALREENGFSQIFDDAFGGGRA